MNYFQSLRSYEDFIYHLPDLYPVVVDSTLVAIRHSIRQMTVAGEIVFVDAYRLVARERLDFVDDSLIIRHYGYEVWQGEEKLYWYDSQAHPDEPTLASTHPHHKHVHPDIKHNRAQWGTRCSRIEFYPTQSPIPHSGNRRGFLNPIENVLCMIYSLKAAQSSPAMVRSKPALPSTATRSPPSATA